MDSVDPDDTCERCKTRKTLESYTLAFSGWMAGMLDLYHRIRAGWPIGKNDLTLDEWRALGRITEWYRLKELELQSRFLTPKIF